jgi:hypothetical protein
MIRLAFWIGSWLLAVLPAASAQQPGYVGRWAAERSWCANRPGTTDELPVRFSARAFEGFELSCRFVRVEGGKGRWEIAARCEGEGMTEQRRFVLVRDRKGLVWREPGRPDFRLVRCG